MANKEIHELITAEELSASDVIAEQRENNGTWLTRKLTFNMLGLFLNKVLNYASDLLTSNKTIIGAINEVNRKTGEDIKLSSNSGNTTIYSKITSIENTLRYQDTNEVSLENAVFPIYDDETAFHFTIPLSKPVASGLEAALSGDFALDGTAIDLSTEFTITTEIVDVGLNVTLTPLTTFSLTEKLIIGDSNSKITFAEEGN